MRGKRAKQLRQLVTKLFLENGNTDDKAIRNAYRRTKREWTRHELTIIK